MLYGVWLVLARLGYEWAAGRRWGDVLGAGKYEARVSNERVCLAL